MARKVDRKERIMARLWEVLREISEFPWDTGVGYTGIYNGEDSEEMKRIIIDFKPPVAKQGPPVEVQ